jgi:serine/threonine-protein kinase RsbW/stage II sporulation protein AB (anti-sigma F factor)
MTDARCEEVAAAVPASVGPLRHAVAAFAKRLGADDDAVSRVQLAVSEAVTNAVVHAFAALPAPGTLTVTAYADGDQMCVLVGDDGAGMAARGDSPGLGIGLPLMTQLSQSLEFRERPGGGTEVAMRFSLAG